MRSLLVAALVAAPFAVGAASAAPDDDTATGHEVTTFSDADIVESSGLVVDGDLAVTMNDSGDEARVFTVDLRTGDTVGTTRFDGDASDLESLAPAGPGHVWVGDTGDNDKDRKDVEVTRVPVGRGDRSVAGETFHLSYPDGPHDAETLLAHPRTGQLFLVSKSPMRGAVYSAPARLRPDGVNVLTRVAEAPGLATDGAFLPDGRHVLVRGYTRATLLEFPGWRPVAEFRLPRQQQGEALAVRADGTVFVSSEGADQPLLRLDLPAEADQALRGTPTPAASPQPSAAESATQAPERPSGEQPDASDGSDSGGSPWVIALFGALGVLLLGGIVRFLRG